MRRETSYLLLRIRLPSALEEDLAAVLWSQGSLGCEIQTAEDGWSTITAYFPDGSSAPAIPAILAPWHNRGVELLASESLADQDWLADYRRGALPFDVGRFRIDPRDEDTVDESPDGVETAILAADRVLLRIPARSAFGTGSHASTRLVLQWLERLSLDELEILDVGTGSAILALAALHLGARRVVGFDADAQSVCIASHNGRLNALSPALFAGRLGALKAVPRFDLALVNVLPERISDELPLLVKVIKPDARVISSGNLQQSREEILAFWLSLGFVLEGEQSVDEWTSFLLRSTSNRP